MYIAANRFRVRKEYQDAFKERWLKRTVHVRDVPGFISFQFLEGALHDSPDNTEDESFRLYISHTIWESEAAFSDWTHSKQYQAAHSQTKQGHVDDTKWREKFFIGRPVFEGFSILQNLFSGQDGFSSPECFAIASGYMATNRFFVMSKEEKTFEERWANSGPHITPAPGFVSFQFLKEAISSATATRVQKLDRYMEPESDGTVYISETFWKCEADFRAWTESDIFRATHSIIATRRNVTLRPAVFEGFDVLQVVTPEKETMVDATGIEPVTPAV